MPKEKGWIFLRIKEEDETLITKINNEDLEHLQPFGHGASGWIHTWSFSSKEDAKEAKEIILKNCPRARDKF